MSQYYFTVASLIHLNYEMDNTPSIDSFLNVCEENVAPKHFELIKSAKIDDLDQYDTGIQILDAWYNWERNLRNKLVLLRARQKKEDPDQYLKENPDQLTGEHVTREAFEHESPLVAEDILNWERWSYLEELELGHYFDLDKLFIYYLKLQILNRKKSFDKEKGTEKFNILIEKISIDDSSLSEESEVIQ